MVIIQGIIFQETGEPYPLQRNQWPGKETEKLDSCLTQRLGTARRNCFQGSRCPAARNRCSKKLGIILNINRTAYLNMQSWGKHPMVANIPIVVVDVLQKRLGRKALRKSRAQSGTHPNIPSITRFPLMYHDHYAFLRQRHCRTFQAETWWHT